MMTSENQTQIFDSATDGGIMPDESLVQGARFRRLKNISVAMPKNKLIVLTGVTGSGKSTLGLDILRKEGRRR
jgi:excinuclease ABC subunit A